MVNRIQNLVIWLFFAPGLLFCKDIKPWYHRILLVLIAPSTYMFFGFIILVISFFTTPFEVGMNFDVNHTYKGANDIIYVTRSYIPECDTLGAKFIDCGLDFEIEERFRMKDRLSQKERDILSNECSRSSSWNETDSTYVYSDRENIEKKISRQDYDYFNVVINKNDSLILVEYGTY